MYLTLAALGALIAFFTYMQTAPAGMFPAWVGFICGGLGLSLTLFAGALKREDNTIAKTRSHPPAPRVVDHAPANGMRQPRRNEHGFVTVHALLVGTLAVVALILLGLWIGGCSQAWEQIPDTRPTQVCTVDEPDPFRAELERWVGSRLVEQQVPMPCLVAQLVARELLDRVIVMARAKAAEAEAAPPKAVP